MAKQSIVGFSYFGNSQMPQPIIAIISSVVATVIFATCLRLQKSIYLLLILLISPIFMLIFINPKWAVVDWHGFMHSSIVFNITNGLVPPEDVLLAGYSLKYPWAHHYLVALLCQIANIAPPMGFALLNILALIVSAVAIFKTAQLLHPTRYTGIFAVFLSIFGTSIFSPLERFESIFRLDPRVFPLEKFASANSNSLGFGLFFVCLFFLIRLFARRGKSFVNATGIFFSIAGTAFLYPICWLAISLTCISVCLGQAIAMRGRNWQQPIWIVLLALFFSSVLAIPYLHSISAGKAATAEMSLNFHVQHRLIPLFLISSFPLVILWVKRHQIKTLFNNHFSEVLILVFGGVGLVFLYMFVSIPLGCEYKFLMLLMAVIGIFTAPFFASFYQENLILATLIITLLLIPTANKFTSRFMQVQFVDPVYTKGINLIHYDTRMHKLYSWIATKTSADTVVVDSFLSVPALSGRSLYVGTDLRLNQLNQEVPFKKHYEYNDGWSIKAKTLSTDVFGQDQEVVKRRLQNAIALLTPNNKDIVNTAAKSVKKEFDQRQVIVIVRDPTIQMAFDSNPRFAKRFEESSVSIYSIE
jgi:hypothetical protein